MSHDTPLQRAPSVVLQIGFGLGEAFLDAWENSRITAPPQGLDFIAIEPHLPSADALRAAHHGTPHQDRAETLAQRWPPRTRNMHRMAFDDGRVRLLLAPGPAHRWLLELRAVVEAFRIDALDLSHDPEGGAVRLGKALARLAAPQASLQAADGLEALRPALASTGFHFDDRTTVRLHGVFAPRFVPRGPSRQRPPPGDRHVLIVGAGLAGCAIACALAEHGWRSTLIDRQEAPAGEGSGNPAGLFHGIVNPQDGAHARFNRAAALQAREAVQQAVDSGLARGSVRGLLRLETSGKTPEAMRAELAAQQLPPDYVQALDAAAASARSGLRLQHPAWFYPGGGWVEPAGLARGFLQRAGTMTRFHGGVDVQRLQPVGDGWQLLDAAGRCVAEAEQVVLANAYGALRLLQTPHWPLQSVRGQISLIDQRPLAPAQRLRLPAVPLAGTGYLLPDLDGWALFGASTQPDDADPALRAADHEFNRQRLHALCGQMPDGTLPLQGRVGWRCVAGDRLPLVGNVPDEARLAGRRAERLIDLPRRAGLHVFIGLASRGISWSALGGQLLAAQISGAPLPLEGSLVDALDPGRFVLREQRQL